MRDDLPPEALDAALQQAMAKDPSARQAAPAGLMREIDGAYPPDARAAGGAGARGGGARRAGPAGR